MAGYVILRAEATSDVPAEFSLDAPVKTEGFCIWAPEGNEQRAQRCVRVGRESGFPLAISPPKAAEFHEDLHRGGSCSEAGAYTEAACRTKGGIWTTKIKTVDITTKDGSMISQIQKITGETSAYLDQFVNVKRMPLMNPYLKRMDYRTMQGFFTNVMMTWGAWQGLKAIKRAEDQYYEQLGLYNDELQKRPGLAKIARDEEWLREYDRQFDSNYVAGDGLSSLDSLLDDTGWVDDESNLANLTDMEKLMHQKTWEMEDLTSGSPFMPDDPFGHSFGDPTWFRASGDDLDDIAADINFAGGGLQPGDEGFATSLNWTKLDVVTGGNVWDVGNFMPKMETAQPTMPNFKAAKMLLGAFLLYKLCSFAVASAVSVYSKMSTHPRGSHAVLSFKSSTKSVSHSARILTNHIGQSAFVSCLKMHLQSHDPFYFLYNAFAGAKEKLSQMGEEIKTLFNKKKDPSGGGLQESYRLTGVDVTTVGKGYGGAPAIVVGAPENSANEAAALVAAKKWDKKHHIEVGKRAQLVGKVEANGDLAKVAVASAGDGYEIDERPPIWIAAPPGDGIQARASAIVLDEGAMVMNQFYRIAVGTLFETLKEIRKSSLDFIKLARRFKSPPKKMNPVLQKGFTANATRHIINSLGTRAADPGDKWEAGRKYRHNETLYTEDGRVYKVLLFDGGLVSKCGIDKWVGGCNNFVLGRGVDHTLPASCGKTSACRGGQGAEPSGLVAPTHEIKDPGIWKLALSERVKRGADPSGLEGGKVVDQGNPKLFYRYEGVRYPAGGGSGRTNLTNLPGSSHFNYVNWLDDWVHTEIETLMFRIAQLMSGKFNPVSSTKKSAGDQSPMGEDVIVTFKGAGQLYPILVPVIDNAGHVRVKVLDPGAGFKGEDILNITISGGGCRSLGGGWFRNPIPLTASGPGQEVFQEFQVLAAVDEMYIAGGMGAGGQWQDSGFGIKSILVSMSERFSDNPSVETSVDMDKSYDSFAPKYFLTPPRVDILHPQDQSVIILNATSWETPVLSPITEVEPKTQIISNWGQKTQVDLTPHERNDIHSKIQAERHAQLNNLAENAMGWKKHWERLYDSATTRIVQVLRAPRFYLENRTAVGRGGENFVAGGAEYVWNIKYKHTARGEICGAIMDYPTCSGDAQPEGGGCITKDDEKLLQGLSTLSPTFGFCDNAKINNMNKKLANTFFKNKLAYNVFSAPATVQEGICGKTSCGAVHAYTTVPPVGLATTHGPFLRPVRSFANEWQDDTEYKLANKESNPEWPHGTEGFPGPYVVNEGHVYVITEIVGDGITGSTGPTQHIPYSNETHDGITYRYLTKGGLDSTVSTDWHWQKRIKKSDGEEEPQPPYKVDNEALDICGNIKLTWKFHPTLNSRVAHEQVSHRFLWMGTGVAIQHDSLPTMYATNSPGAGTVGRSDNIQTRYLRTSEQAKMDWSLLSWNTNDKMVRGWGDVSLPEIWGAWSDTLSHGDTLWQRAIRKVAGGIDGGIGVFKTVLGFLTEAHLPNYAIFIKENSKTPDDKFRSARDAITKRAQAIKMHYINRRLIDYGWGPYAKEWGGEECPNVHCWKRGKQINEDFISAYQGAHACKVLQGMYNDLVVDNAKSLAHGWVKSLKGEVSNQAGRLAGNIHPSSYQVATLGWLDQTFTSDEEKPIDWIEQGVEPYPQFEAPPMGREEGYGDSTSALFPLGHGKQDPLMVTRKLSGICFPVIKYHETVWKRMMFQTSGDLNDFEHWGMQRETAGASTTAHHSAFSKLVPKAILENKPSWMEGMTETEVGKYYGWPRMVIGQDGSERGLNQPFYTRESQEISTYEEKFEGGRKHEVEPYANLQGIDGEGESANPWAPNTTNYDTCEMKTPFRQGHANQPRGGAWSDSTQDNLGPKSIPALDFNTTFRGKGEWNELATELDEQMGRWAAIFPKIYVEQLGTTTIVKSGVIPGSNTNELGPLTGMPIGPNAAPYSDPDPINFHDFFESYVVWDNKPSSSTKSDWELAKDAAGIPYDSCWAATYESEIKGKYLLMGSGYTKQEAFKMCHGQSRLYHELINKFHNTGKGIYSTETGFHDFGLTREWDKPSHLPNIPYPDGQGGYLVPFEATGFGCDTEKATAMAKAHLTGQMYEALLDLHNSNGKGVCLPCSGLWSNGNCTDAQYTTQTTCEDASETWTPNNGGCKNDIWDSIHGVINDSENLTYAVMSEDQHYEAGPFPIPVSPSGLIDGHQGQCQDELPSDDFTKTCKWKGIHSWFKQANAADGSKFNSNSPYFGGCLYPCVLGWGDNFKLFGYDCTANVPVGGNTCQFTSTSTSKNTAYANLQTKIDNKDNEICDCVYSGITIEAGPPPRAVPQSDANTMAQMGTGWDGVSAGTNPWWEDAPAFEAFLGRWFDQGLLAELGLAGTRGGDTLNEPKIRATGATLEEARGNALWMWETYTTGKRPGDGFLENNNFWSAYYGDGGTFDGVDCCYCKTGLQVAEFNHDESYGFPLMDQSAFYTEAWGLANQLITCGGGNGNGNGILDCDGTPNTACDYTVEASLDWNVAQGYYYDMDIYLRTVSGCDGSDSTVYFGAPQANGCRLGDGEWKLSLNHDAYPTCSTGPDSPEAVSTDVSGHFNDNRKFEVWFNQYSTCAPEVLAANLTKIFKITNHHATNAIQVNGTTVAANGGEFTSSDFAYVGYGGGTVADFAGQGTVFEVTACQTCPGDGGGGSTYDCSLGDNGQGPWANFSLTGIPCPGECNDGDCDGENPIGEGSWLHQIAAGVRQMAADTYQLELSNAAVSGFGISQFGGAPMGYNDCISYDEGQTSFGDLVDQGKLQMTTDSEVITRETCTHDPTMWDDMYMNLTSAPEAPCGCAGVNCDGTVGYDISQGPMLPPTPQAIPEGYKCYNRNITVDLNGSLYPMREQIISGHAGTIDGTDMCGILSQTFWATLTPLGGEEGHWKYEIPLEGCNTWVAGTSGVCPTTDKNLDVIKMTGDIHCKFEHHKYKAPLLKSVHSGIMWASGHTPWVRGRADWTNAGHILYHYGGVDKDGKPKRSVSAWKTEQEYYVHYPEASGVDVELADTYVSRGKQKHISSTQREAREALNDAFHQDPNNPDAHEDQHKKDQRNSAIRAKTLGIQTFGKKLQRVVYDVGRDEVDLKEGTTTQTVRNTKRGSKSGDKGNSAVARGDLVFMGGWPISNTSWPHDAYDRKEWNSAKQRMFGKSVVLLITDPRLAAASLDWKEKEEAGKLRKNFEVKVKGNVYKDGSRTHQILAAFRNGDKYESFLNELQASANVAVKSYGACKVTIKVDNKVPLLSRLVKNEDTFEGFYAETEGELAACHHCLADEINDSDGQDQLDKRTLFFGEQYMVSMKTEWEIRSGNYFFEVPFTRHSYQVPNPMDPTKTIKVKPWDEYLMHVSEKYDAKLARTGYYLAGNTENSAFAPGLPCEAYSKYEKIIDFTIQSDRRWTEIPRGGMIEGINVGMNEPYWAGEIDIEEPYGGNRLLRNAHYDWLVHSHDGAWTPKVSGSQAWDAWGYDSKHYVNESSQPWASLGDQGYFGKGDPRGYVVNTPRWLFGTNNRCCDLRGGGQYGKPFDDPSHPTMGCL